MRFSVAVPRLKKTQASSKFRKYGRLCRPGGLRREYKKLRSLLPGATRSRQLRKKVGVVEAAYQYICELQTALLDKFSTKGIPEDLAGVVRGKVATASDIQALALHLINNSATASSGFLRSPFIGAPPLVSSRLISSSSSEMEDNTVASTSRLRSLDDALTSSSNRLCGIPNATTASELHPITTFTRFCHNPDAFASETDATSSFNSRLSSLSQGMSASEANSVSAPKSRVSCLPQEASASDTINDDEVQHQTRRPTINISLHSSSDTSSHHHSIPQSQATTSDTLSTHKCITLSSLHSVMNTLLPSSSSSSSSLSASPSSIACSSFACTQSSSSVLIE